MDKERNTCENLPRVGGWKAARRLYQIWYAYELSSKRPENNIARQESLSELKKVLSEDAMAYLDEEVATQVDGLDTSPVTRGVQIRRGATRDAIRERARNRSQGEKLAVRRNKAHERRGTPRDLIH